MNRIPKNLFAPPPRQPPSPIPPGSPAIRQFHKASPFHTSGIAGNSRVFPRLTLSFFRGRRPSLGLFARLEFVRHRGPLPGNDHAHPRIPEGSKTVACSGAIPGSSAGSLGPKTQEVQGLLTPVPLVANREGSQCAMARSCLSPLSRRVHTLTIRPVSPPPSTALQTFPVTRSKKRCPRRNPA